MITYIVQVLLFQILFLAVYDFFLSKETFHKYNRWYLIGTPLISFVMPLIKIPTFQKAVPEEIMIFLPEIVLSPQKAIEQTSYYTESSINYLNLLFWTGVFLFSIVFLIKLIKIFRLISQNETIKKPFYKLVLLPKQTTAFSFFNFIFLGKNISKEKREEIIEHELVHSKQKHSLDLLFFEFLRIAMWFNPMIYFYQQRITLLHEYISDSEVVKTTEKHDYFNKLLSQTFQVENISFVNQFYKHSFIKKRITMMTKNKSKHIKKAKYLLLLPLLTSMLMYTSCETNQVEEPVQEKFKKTIYTEFSKGIKVTSGKKEGYLDMYIGTGTPEGVEITEQDLTSLEKLEYDNHMELLNDFLKGKFKKLITIKLYKKSNGRVTLASIHDFSKMKNNKTYNVETNSVPFAIIEEVPVYPGCVGTRAQKAACLNKKIKKSFLREFNGEISKDLGLSKGRKKIWVIFKIDESGNVVDINARAPHPKLKEEAIRVASLLPKMVPGKQRGKAVGMKYTLPISFNVE